MVLFNPYSEDKEGEVHTFLKGICPKVNGIAQQEFKLTTILQSSALTIIQRGPLHLQALNWASEQTRQISYENTQ